MLHLSMIAVTRENNRIKMNMKFLKNCVLGLCVALMLIGCTAVELMERHTSSAYGLGQMYEKGHYNPDSPSSNVKQSYEDAYGSYLVADRLGDIRAKAKIDLIVSHLSAEKKIEIEKKVNSFSIRELKKYYKVPLEYDLNQRK